MTRHLALNNAECENMTWVEQRYSCPSLVCFFLHDYLDSCFPFWGGRESIGRGEAFYYFSSKEGGEAFDWHNTIHTS